MSPLLSSFHISTFLIFIIILFILILPPSALPRHVCLEVVLRAPPLSLPFSPACFVVLQRRVIGNWAKKIRYASFSFDIFTTMLLLIIQKLLSSYCPGLKPHVLLLFFYCCFFIAVFFIAVLSIFIFSIAIFLLLFFSSLINC